GLPNHCAQRRLVGQSFAKLLARTWVRHAGGHADRVGQGDLVGIGTFRTVVFALLLVRIAPQGTDDHAVAANGPSRDARMEDRREWLPSELRDEEIMGGLEG